MAELSIIIVNFNSGDYLLECLESIEKVSDEADIFTYVVDNASTDDSIKKAKEKFNDVAFIVNRLNLGFGKANNLALRAVKTEYVLLLNPDTKIQKGVLSKMIGLMNSDVKIGAATCKIVLGNGSIDLTAHRGFPTPWASFLYHFFQNDSLYHLTYKDMTKTHEVDSIAGAFFFTRKSVLDQVGSFDEDYFLYAEDIDLCFRIKKSGYKIIYEPSVEVIHQKGVSSGLKKHSQDIAQADKQTKLKAFESFYESMRTFYKKHYEKKYPFFINWLVYLGINLREWQARRKMVV